MKYNFTPDDCQGLADALIDDLKKNKFKVSIEEPIDSDAPYRTTLIAKKRENTMMVEVMKKPSCSKSFADFSNWLASERLYCELYVAIHDESEMIAGVLNDFRKKGIGLILVDDQGSIQNHQPARNPCLVVSNDPTLKLGQFKNEIIQIIDKHNEGNSKDAVRDLCELVEGFTEIIIYEAQKKGMLTITIEQIKRLKWSNQIDLLATQSRYVPGLDPLIDADLKTDLHSFRGARNLFDHAANTAEKKRRRARQIVERLHMGRRLIHELRIVKRSIK